MSAVSTCHREPVSLNKRQQARALFARLRHKQLLSAMSGRISESAIYAQRALRVKQAVCAQ